jgi:hypothetical protein
VLSAAAGAEAGLVARDALRAGDGVAELDAAGFAGGDAKGATSPPAFAVSGLAVVDAGAEGGDCGFGVSLLGVAAPVVGFAGDDGGGIVVE